MRNIRNRARERLEAGDLALGAGLRLARTVETAKALKTAGFDWLFIDAERNAMSIDTIAQLSAAAHDAGITPLVRVPHGRYDLAARALDGGALGIIMPHMENADEVRALVDTVKYRPVGHRSYHPGQPVFDFEVGDHRRAMETMNAATMVVAMVESPESAAAAADMAAVPGLDVLLVGNTDLTCELGIPGETEHPSVIAAYETVIAACRQHGKWPGMGGACSERAMARLVGMGIRMIYAGSDLDFLLAGGRLRAASVRGHPGPAA